MDIKKYADIIENRLDDEECTMESVLKDNSRILELAIKHKVNVMFSSDNDNIAELKSKIEQMIREKFGLLIPVHIIEKEHENE